MHLDGALTKRMQAGQAASAGVFSAVLAQTGFIGAHDIFNGRFGFFELYQPYGVRRLGTSPRSGHSLASEDPTAHRAALEEGGALLEAGAVSHNHHLFR
jgi:MmgE/PrpD N-terminal domain